MRHFRWLVPFLLLLVLFAIPAQTHAQARSLAPARPLADCSAECSSFSEWFGTQNGVLETIYVPNYSVTCCALGRYVEEYYHVPGTTDYIDVGISFKLNSGSGEGCGSASGGFFYGINHNGTLVSGQCYPFNSGDKNHTVEIGISGGSNGLIDIWIHNTGSGNNPCNPCMLTGTGAVTSWNQITIWESVIGTWTGILQGGSNITRSQYHSSAWNYQSRAADATISSNPPVFEWPIVPAPGNNGGVATVCEKDTGVTTCA